MNGFYPFQPGAELGQPRRLGECRGKIMRRGRRGSLCNQGSPSFASSVCILESRTIGQGWISRVLWKQLDLLSSSEHRHHRGWSPNQLPHMTNPLSPAFRYTPASVVWVCILMLVGFFSPSLPSAVPVLWKALGYQLTHSTPGAASMQITAGPACLSSQTVWHYNCLPLIFPLPRLSICFQFLHLLGWLRYPTGFCPRHPLLHLLCSQLWNTGTLKHFYKQDSITGLFCLPEILAGTEESFHLHLLHASLAVGLVNIALHKSEFFAQFSGQECPVSVQCHSTLWKDGQGGGENLKKGALQVMVST